MKVLLTGATGFIGSHTAEKLVQEDYQVRCLIRSNANVNFLQQLIPEVELVEGSINDSSSLRRAVLDVDAIIHCAGLIKAKTWEDFFNVNAQGTHNLLEAAKSFAPNLRRFVLVSSLSACGASLNNPVMLFNEGEVKPVSKYGYSKLQAEIIAKNYAELLPITVIRPSVVYGPRDLTTLSFFKIINHGFIPLVQRGMGVASTIYVRDVASALINAVKLDVPSGSAYFLEDGALMTWRERYYQLSQHTTRHKLIEIPVPNFFLQTAAWINENYGHLRKKAVFLTRDKMQELKQQYWVCSSETAQRDLLWRPTVSWLEGTGLTYAWYKKEGWL
jgi:nucleoside-diphosphate-sugar epimerase